LSGFTQQELDAGRVSFAHDKDAATTGQFAVIVTDKDGLATLSRTVLVLAGDQAAPTPDMQGQLRGEINASTSRQQTLDKTLRALCPAYADITRAIATGMNTLPPGAAMAGIYTMVDNSRGVWKAPANVSLSSVSSPTVTINHDQQETLNVSTTGKSINAIRPFVGEGTLVWGARTLDGNSLDWRYINVRRTMIMIEESIKLAAKAYVFEPNVANTWVTIRAMIENFLTGVWKQGGLAGAVPADAFSVHVGLGDTMTPEDVLEGILRITVMVALTRPAEFIEITFRQQMQKS
nr:phage tail protein [Roseovarius sp.]